MQYARTNPRFLALIVLAVGTVIGCPGQVTAATLAVTHCGDSGPGSLRDRIAAAAEGDVVDLRGLACRQVTLTSGPILIAQRELTVEGAGFDRITISGDYNHPVFRQQQPGVLTLRRMSIQKGVLRAPLALGGCIYTAGRLELLGVHVHHCSALGTGPDSTVSAGGGVYAEGNVDLQYSNIHHNTARATDSDGGGLYTAGTLSLKRVVVHSNAAMHSGGIFAAMGMTMETSTVRDNRAQRFGGVHVERGNAVVMRSTISGNTASLGSIGGLYAQELRMSNSTVSGNRGKGVSAIFVSTGRAAIYSTTVTANIEEGRPSQINVCMGAVYVGSEVATEPFRVESSLIAGNLCPGYDPVDLRALVVVGSNNLIQRSAHAPPVDTISSDPLLAPLGDNGGYTLTHAPLPGSPAIDRGNNVRNLPTDQRGNGFPRVNGARADIGAVER